MIEDKITYDGEEIFCIYHKNVDDLKPINHSESKKINGKVLRFSECYIDDSYVCKKVNSLPHIQGLLEAGSDINPYNCSASALCTHYYCSVKSRLIFGSNFDNICEIETIQEIIKFIKKYCGVNLERYPLYLGDIFIMQPIVIDIKRNHDEEDITDSIIFEEIPIDTTLVIHFKAYDYLNQTEYIIESKVINIVDNDKFIKVDCSNDWKSIDVYLYKNGNLIYKQKNIFFMKSICMNISIENNPDLLNLKRLKPTFIHISSSEESITIGEPTISHQLCQINSKITNQLIKDESRVLIFDSEEEREKEYIVSELENAKDEIIIIDCYFTDYRDEGVKDKIFDWLLIISRMQAKCKKIIYYVTSSGDNKKAFTADELKEECKIQPVTMDYCWGDNKLGIHCIETKSIIHDRFVFAKSGDLITCNVIGTSFNSLGKSLHCIHRYTGNEASRLYDTVVKKALTPNNIDKELLI